MAAVLEFLLDLSLSLSLSLCFRSTCQYRGDNEKNNYMLSATSNTELEFFIKSIQSQLHCIVTRGRRFAVPQSFRAI